MSSQSSLDDELIRCTTATEISAKTLGQSRSSAELTLLVPSLPVLSFTETDELNWNCELSDWFWSFTELS